MADVPDESVGLSFTSPPYGVLKEYDTNLSFTDYLALISRVASEVYRVLVPGGRYIINCAGGLGRKPWLPITAYFQAIHADIGFIPTGEIIWRKAKGSNELCLGNMDIR